MRRIDDIINDVELEIAQATGQEKTASVAAEEDIFGLAERLRKSAAEAPVVPDVSEKDLDTLTEKVAHAIAICDTLVNMPLLVKLAAFEKQAVARGFTEEQIEEYISKEAAGKYHTLLKALPWLGGGAATTTAAAVGHSKGKKKGEETGYVQALQDVDTAMRSYAQG